MGKAASSPLFAPIVESLEPRLLLASLGFPEDIQGAFTGSILSINSSENQEWLNSGVNDATPIRAMPGDLRVDGKLDSSDLALLQDVVAGGQFMPSADLNLDGAVDEQDIAVFEGILQGMNASEEAQAAQYHAYCDGWDGPGQNSVSLKYYFATVISSTWKTAIINAANEWAIYAQITWTSTLTSGQIKSVDITFAYIDGLGGALAESYFPSPPNSEPIAGNIEFDEDEYWTTTGGGTDLFTVALHELGHSLGLDHSDDSDAVMWPYYTGRVTGLSTDDIEGIRSIYAARNSGGDIYEPDNTAGQATIISTSGSPQSHSITPVGDVDWAKFTLAATSSVSVETDGASGDTKMWLYGPNSSTTQIAYDDDSGNGLFSMIQETLDAGTYYVKIAQFGSNETIPSYTISVYAIPINTPPTLTTINTLTNATEDTDFTISYATLAAAANEADVDGDPISFRIEQVSSGTLTKGGVLVTPGSTLLSSGESLVWHPAANANGTLNAFTVKASDGQAASSTAVQVKVDVAAVNDAPTLDVLANPAAIDEDAGQQTVSLTGITAGGGESQTLQVTAASSNPALIPNPTVIYTSPNTTGSLTYTPVRNASGTAVVTVVVRDAGLDGTLGTADDGTTQRTFTVTVNPVNDAPTLEVVANPAAIKEDAGQQTVNLTGITAGGGESQTLQVTASSSNTGLIPDPVVTYTSPNTMGSLTYTPVGNASGTATITVTVRDAGLDGTLGNPDDGTIQRTFTVTVNPVPDAPTLTVIALLAGAYRDNDFGISYQMLADAADEADADGDALSFWIVSITTGAVSGGSTLSPGGSLIWHPKTGAVGILNAFTVMVYDGHLFSGTSVQVQVEVSALPDLSPTAVSSDVWQSAAPGTLVNWTATVKNNGPGWQRADWTVEWYLSSDKTYQATDTLVGSQTYRDDLAPGASLTETISAAVPGVPTAGQKYVIARVVNAGPDGKAGNNVKASADTDWFGFVTPTPGGSTPETATDLGYVAGTFTRPNQSLSEAGQKVFYKFTTLGPATTANYVRIDFNNAEGDLYLKLYRADGTQVGATANTANAYERVGLNDEKLRGLPEGTYYVEVGANNGDISPGFKLTILAPKGPDLAPTVANSSVNRSAAPGTLVDWTATVKNNGPGWQRADWTVQWYLSSDTTYQATDTLISSQAYSDDIAPGASVSKAMNAAVPAVPTAGQKYLIARVVNAGLDGVATNNIKASLDKDWFGPIATDSDDAAARNDTLAAATDLGLVKGTSSRLNRTIDVVDVLAGAPGADWYKFSIARTGGTTDKARIDFLNTEGDLTLRLVDAGGSVLKTSDTAGNFEEVSLNDLLAGKYYLQVFGKNGDVSRGYGLSLRTPV